MPLRKLLFCLSAALLMGLATMASARADIVVLTNTNAGGTPVNLNGTASSPLVTGTTGSGAIVNFTGTTAGGGTNLEAEQGAAIISGPGSPGSDPNLLSLTYGLQSGAAFTSTQFNVDATADGFLRITLTGAGLTLSADSSTGVTLVSQNATTLVFDIPVDGAGQNITNFLAIQGQGITSVTIAALGGVEMDLIRQFRIDGQVAPVPEPTTMLLLGTGLAGIAAKVRRRRRAGSE